MKQATGPHILVVDDELHMANSIKFILSLENYRVSLAGNGLEALEVLKGARESEHPVELVVTDVWMPKMDGPGMLEALESEKIVVPVLVITAMDIGQVQVELARFGCSGFMSKPFDDTTLLKKVSIILSGKGPLKVDDDDM